MYHIIPNWIGHTGIVAASMKEITSLFKSEMISFWGGYNSEKVFREVKTNFLLPLPLVVCFNQFFSTVFVFDKLLSWLVSGLLQCVFGTCCNPPALRRHLLLLLQVSTLYTFSAECDSRQYDFPLVLCSCLQGLFPKRSPQASQVRTTICDTASDMQWRPLDHLFICNPSFPKCYIFPKSVSRPISGRIHCPSSNVSFQTLFKEYQPQLNY